MKYEIQLAGSSGKKTRSVELERDGESWRIKLDGEPVSADAAEIVMNTLSILLDGKTYEFHVRPSGDGLLKLQTGTQEFTAEVIEPRAWSGRRHGGIEAEGRQQVVAPMPGKVIRVLVRAGETVGAGQGLLVVEAMKMQNEVRSPKSGTVERVLVKEGQPVNAGDTLCIVS
jgi:biotin carboxyl carrier protein